jgi:hypothetical protein
MVGPSPHPAFLKFLPDLMPFQALKWCEYFRMLLQALSTIKGIFIDCWVS